MPDDLPFAATKIPVSYSLHELEQLAAEYPGRSLCLYLADKTPEDWERSTSRVYMNQIDPNLLYAPLNVTEGDTAALEAIYRAAQSNRAICAINHTHPHKNNEPLRAQFVQDADAYPIIDVLVREQTGQFTPYNLNGPAFGSWFASELGIKHTSWAIVGVGGAGSAIARYIAEQGWAREIHLIDQEDKTAFARSLAEFCNVYVPRTVADVSLDFDVLIDATGRGLHQTLMRLLTRPGAQRGSFVDLRAQTNLDTVEFATTHSWRAFSGTGMNARNDYALITLITRALKLEAPSLADFTQQVDRATNIISSQY